MTNDLFTKLETAAHGEHCDLSAVLSALRFSGNGLLPVVTQCVVSGRVLMLAWMSIESLQETLRLGDMVYYSRRRQKLWRKGETSGCIQKWRSLRVDCDGDALLAEVEQTGPACHTKHPSCFYLRLDQDGLTVDD